MSSKASIHADALYCSFTVRTRSMEDHHQTVAASCSTMGPPSTWAKSQPVTASMMHSASVWNRNLTAASPNIWKNVSVEDTCEMKWPTSSLTTSWESCYQIIYCTKRNENKKKLYLSIDGSTMHDELWFILLKSHVQRVYHPSVCNRWLHVLWVSVSPWSITSTRLCLETEPTAVGASLRCHMSLLWWYIDLYYTDAIWCINTVGGTLHWMDKESVGSRNQSIKFL